MHIANLPDSDRSTDYQGFLGGGHAQFDRTPLICIKATNQIVLLLIQPSFEEHNDGF
jgi:hypothetical protein